MRVLKKIELNSISGCVCFPSEGADETVIGYTKTVFGSDGAAKDVLVYARFLGTGKLYYYNENLTTLQSIPPFDEERVWGGNWGRAYNWSGAASDILFCTR